MNPSTSRMATGSLNPDSASKRAGEPPPQGRAAQQSEDRRSVRGGEDRAEQQPLQQREAEQPAGGQSGDDGRHDRPQHRQRERRPQHRADLEITGRQATLEQDQGERDDADRPRQLVVVELDPARRRRSRSPSRGRGRGPVRAACRRAASSDAPIPAASRDPATRISSASLTATPFHPARPPPGARTDRRLQSRPWRRRTSPSRASRARRRRCGPVRYRRGSWSGSTSSGSGGSTRS